LSIKDRDAVLKINNGKENSPNFIKCTNLDTTIGRRNIQLKYIPDHLRNEDIAAAIEKHIGSISKIDISQDGDYATAVCSVEVKINDKNFKDLRNIKCKNSLITVAAETHQHNNKCKNNNRGKITRNKITCKY